MARRGDEVDAETLQIVVRIVQGVNLQLAAVAGARIHHADGERSAIAALDKFGDLCAQAFDLSLSLWQRLGDYASAQDLTKYLHVHRLTDRARNRSS